MSQKTALRIGFSGNLIKGTNIYDWISNISLTSGNILGLQGFISLARTPGTGTLYSPLE